MENPIFLHILFKNHLLENGVEKENIISIELALLRNIRFINPLELSSFVTGKIQDKEEKFFFFIDEIQLSDEVKSPYNSGERFCIAEENTRNIFVNRCSNFTLVQMRRMVGEG